jgi:hypothetical protein
LLPLPLAASRCSTLLVPSTRVLLFMLQAAQDLGEKPLKASTRQVQDFSGKLLKARQVLAPQEPQEPHDARQSHASRPQWDTAQERQVLAPQEPQEPHDARQSLAPKHCWRCTNRLSNFVSFHYLGEAHIHFLRLICLSPQAYASGLQCSSGK